MTTADIIHKIADAASVNPEIQAFIAKARETAIEEGWSEEKWSDFKQWILRSLYFEYLKYDKEAFDSTAKEIYEELCNAE